MLVDANVAAVQALVQRRTFARDGGAETDQRQDHDDDDRDDADAGRERLAIREPPREPCVQRINDDAERNRPENRLHEAADQPEERERDGQQQGDEKRSFDVATRSSRGTCRWPHGGV